MPSRWVRQINVMTAFAAIAAGIYNADIEARVAARATCLGVTGLAVEHAVGECGRERFGRRAMVNWTEEAAIRCVRNCAAAPSEVLKIHCQTRVTQLMGAVIEMAACCITAPVGLVVLSCRVHLDTAVPMITIRVRGPVKGSVVGGCLEGAAACGLFHAVTDRAGVMQADIGNSAVGNWGGDI